MCLSEEEYALLITEAVGGKSILCSFGLGFVKLQDIPINKWAFDRINEIRNPVQI